MSDIVAKALARFDSKEAVIGVVGLGYVGQPLLLRYSELGYKVFGFDVDLSKVEELNEGRSRIEHISNARVRDALEKGFEATNDFKLTKKCDALILCVPTPLNQYREPDVSFIVNTIDTIKPYLREGQVVSLESTTYPGTTEEILKPRLEETGLVVGKSVFLVYSPEREDPGNPNFSTKTIPKVIGGATAICKRLGISLYEKAIDSLVPVSTTQAAELTKLLENIHRAVNIGLANEMKIISDQMGIDIFEVIDAAATKPFGFTPFYPGPGLGGHCIPIDPYYLSWKAREYGLNTRFIELSGEVNRSMPDFVIGKLMDGLNDRGKALSQSKILVLGISYKKNVDDMRESPSVEIMDRIRRKGAQVSYSDPFVPIFGPLKDYDYRLVSIDLNEKVISEYDAIVLTTDHDNFDYEVLLARASLIIDTRGRFRGEHKNLLKA